jgi:dTDP-L-rhamnose 4-epimerase
VKPSTCIITGGAGFIGCAISAGLSQRFDRIIAVDIMHPQVHKSPDRPAALHEKVELFRLDITDPASWDQILRDVHPTTVIHLAAETGTGQSITEATRHAHVNVTGTTVMLDALVRHDRIPEQILLTSSRAVYGDGAWEDPQTGAVSYPGYRSRAQLARGEWDFPGLRSMPCQASETVPYPTSVYGATKLAQEHVLRAWSSAFGSVPIITRLQNVYGPGQSLTNPYTGIVSLFCRLARAGNSIPLYEDGEMLRDFVLIDDVASGLLAALDRSVIGRYPYDIGTGKPSSIADIAARIAELYGAPAPHICGLYRFGDVRHAACRIEPTLSQLDWQPQFNVQRGLLLLKDWIELQFEREEGLL